MFKYLLGRMRLNDAEGEALKDTVLAVTRRCDGFQHFDMCRLVGMIPFNGGFCGSALKGDNYFPGQFNGKSISCNVGTDDYVVEQIKEDLLTHEIYVVSLEHDRRKYLTAIFVPEGTIPADPINKDILATPWEKRSPQEFCDLFKEIFDDPYYF